MDAIDNESIFIKNYYMNAAKFLIIMLVVSSSITAQNLVFDEMDHLPEYNIFSVYLNDSEVILSSLENRCNVVSVLENNDQELITTEDLSSVVYFQLTNDKLLSSNLSDFFIYENRTFRKIFQDTFNVGIKGYVNPLNSNIYIPTNTNVYYSEDLGESFDIINSYNNSERDDFILTSRSVDNKIVNLILSGSGKYFIEVRDVFWNRLVIQELDFTSFSFQIYNDQILIPDHENNLIVMDFDLNILEKIFIENFGPQINIFEDIIISTNFSDGILQVLNNEFNVIQSVVIGHLASNSNSEKFFLFNDDFVMKPTSLNPLRFDTITPNVTATKINDLKTYNDNIYVQTDNAFYAFEEDEWIQRQQGGLRFEVDHAGNVLVDGPDTGLDEIWHSTDNALSFSKLPIDFIIGTRMINFEDTTLVTGRQNCDEFNNSFDSGMTTDGSVSWQSNVVEEPRCFEQRFTTITPDRVYIYDHDEDYALGPGNAIYSWFSYYNRNDKTFFNVGGDPAIMPFIPTSSNQLSSNNVSFYVSPDEIFYANPLKDNVSGYHSLDRGSTWIETPDSPTGRIYPTADSIGTIVIQNDPDGKLGTKFFLRYDLDEPYVELNVSPELPPIEYLKYTSDGHMIVASETGYFYITDGITSAIDEVSTQQNRVVVYPNPTSDILHIRSQDVVQEVRISDIDGRLIYRTSYVEEALSIRTWLSGMYIVEVMMRDGQRVVEKVVKI